MWELHQHRRINAANRRIAGVEASAEVKDRRRANDIEVLEDRLDRLILVNAAIWGLVRDRTGLTEDDLLAEVERLDAEDGSVDGRRRVQPVSCRSCGAKVNPQAGLCQFCGAPPPTRGVFETL